MPSPKAKPAAKTPRKAPPAKKAPVKRAAKPKTKAKAIPLTAWQKWTAADEKSLDSLCDRIEGGEGFSQIAASLGVSTSTVTRWVDADPQRSARAREARAKSAQTWDDKALQGIEDAADPFELAKAKERAHHLRWRASKINPKEYGDKIDVKQEVSFQNLTDAQIDAELARISEKLASVTGSGASSS